MANIDRHRQQAIKINNYLMATWLFSVKLMKFMGKSFISSVFQEKSNDPSIFQVLMSDYKSNWKEENCKSYSLVYAQNYLFRFTTLLRADQYLKIHWTCSWMNTLKRRAKNGNWWRYFNKSSLLSLISTSVKFIFEIPIPWIFLYMFVLMVKCVANSKSKNKWKLYKSAYNFSFFAESKTNATIQKKTKEKNEWNSHSQFISVCFISHYWNCNIFTLRKLSHSVW